MSIADNQARSSEIRLLHLIGSIDPAIGGPVEGIKNQSLVFPDHDIRQEVATLDQPDASFLSSFPLKVYALGMRGSLYRKYRTSFPLFRYRYSPRFRPWLRQNLNNYDAVIVNGLWTFTTLGSADLLRRSGKKYFVFLHGALDPWFKQSYPVKHWVKQAFWLGGDGRLLKGAAAVLFTSEEERQLAKDQFWGYSYNERVVGYGILDPPEPAQNQTEAFRRRTPELKGRRYLLFLGRISPKKGCDLLIRAFASIADLDANLDLVIAGPDENGLQSSLIFLADKLGISHRIHWPGMLQGDAKWGAYRGAEAFVLPSHTENFGIVVVEALACGIPVLISDKVNIWRDVFDANAGIVRPDTIEGTVDLLREWIRIGEKGRKQLSAFARPCFLDRFYLRKNIETLISLIKSEVKQSVGRDQARSKFVVE